MINILFLRSIGLRLNMKKNKIKFFGWPLGFWFAIIILVGLKLWLVSGQHLMAIGGAAHDDALFINITNNLLKGKWLGDFNNLTLAKGPFYPFWIFLSYQLHLPLLLSQHLLYILASLILIIALRPIFKKNWILLLVFAVVLINPMSFTNGTANRVIREGIYPALTLLSVAFFLGLIIRIQNNLKLLLAWSAGAGTALTFFWLTREEGVWILPFIFLVVAYAIFLIWKNRDVLFWKKIVLLIFPFFLLLLSLGIISTVNYAKYGMFDTVEFKNKDFLAAYGSLARIKFSEEISNVPVSIEKRKLIYSISPAFKELEVFFDGGIGKRWVNVSSQNLNLKENKEIRGGWFMWAFRDAVAKAGYYKNGKKVTAYYARLAQEIDLACEENKIECFPERVTMTPPWKSSYNLVARDAFFKGLIYTIKLEGFSAKSSISTGGNSALKKFTRITREDVKMNDNQQKILILEKIGDFYKILSPLLFVLALIIFSFSALRKKNYKNLKFFLAFLFLLLIIIRIFILALIEATSFPSINSLYLSSIYPILFLFIIFNFVILFEELSENIKNRK